MNILPPDSCDVCLREVRRDGSKQDKVLETNQHLACGNEVLSLVQNTDPVAMRRSEINWLGLGLVSHEMKRPPGAMH